MVAGCHHKQSNANSENDSIVNIKEIGIADTTIISEEGERIVHAKMGYYDFDQIENLVSFFDSILVKHPMPIWLSEEDSINQAGYIGTIKRSTHHKEFSINHISTFWSMIIDDSRIERYGSQTFAHKTIRKELSFPFTICFDSCNTSLYVLVDTILFRQPNRHRVLD